MVSSTKNPSVLGDTITLTAVVAPSATTTVPTGMLVLKDGSGTLASGTLDATGSFSYTTSALTQGTHPIQASYGGDPYFAGSSSQVLSQVVNHSAAVAPTLTWATPASIAYGTPLSATQLNAAATDATGAAVPGVYTYVPAAGTILNAGAQTLSVTFTPTDLNTFVVATKTVILTVLQGTPGTTLAITSGGSSATTVAAGSVVTLTAMVRSGAAGVVPGQVNFCDATAAFCDALHRIGLAQLNSSGAAVISFMPGIGSHSYKAAFLGTTNNAPSASAGVPLSVTGKFATSTKIAQSGSVGNYTLTATTVGLAPASIPPTGAVSFLDQTNSNLLLGSANLGNSTAAVNLLSSSAPATGREPVFIATGDFNGDGKLDVAIANGGTVGFPATGRTLTILLGNGDGTFRAAANPTTGNVPSGVAVGDFNGDGKLDLAVTNAADNTLSILLGNGDGTFTPAASPATGSGPNGIATGDFNQDGIADLAVTNMFDNTVSILLGNGDGTFTSAGTLATGGNPNTVVVSDFNGDGKPDLAIANTGEVGLNIFAGNGDGTFTAVSSAAVANIAGGDFASVVPGDFNADGKADLVVLSGGNQVTGSVLLGNGDGTFSFGSAIGGDVTYAAGVAVQDFNGDGKSDIVVTDDQRTLILLSNGDGTFTAGPSSPLGNNDDPDYRAITAGDFNGDGVPDLVFSNSDLDAVSVVLTQLTQTATASASGISPAGTGVHQVVASYAGDLNFAASVSGATSLTGLQTTPVLSWTPSTGSIVYGTPLGAQQLNATAVDGTGTAIQGVFTYLPAAGAVLSAGTQKLTVTFVPTDTRFLTVSGSATITVTQATPGLAWATPTSIAYGTALSGVQLNASVTGVGAASLPGVATYTPSAGTVLNPGTQTLSVSFAPADALDYTSISGNVKLLVTGVGLTSFTPNTATLGDGNKTITLTGSGFVASSVVQVNGVSVATAFVNPATLTAVIPAADFANVGTLQITVLDPAISSSSAALPLVVTAAAASVTLTGPTTTPPGSQPTVSLTINNPYPIPLTAVFTLAFNPAVTPAVDDPAIQFANGGRTYSFTVAANSTAVPPIALQSGTVAGTITIPLTLTAGGANVTPTNLQPVVITIPAAVPAVSTTTLTRNGSQLTLAIHGFSNTREMTQASFQFTGVGGAQIDTPNVTAAVGTLFTGWFSSAASAQYGSTFTYTQVFNVSGSADTIGSVQVTLTNTVGASTVQTAQ
jgi:hypothetical protein